MEADCRSHRLKTSRLLNRIFDGLTREKRYKGFEVNEWVGRASGLWSEINTIQPFRGGNGITAQEFIRQLGLENGFALQWRHTSSVELHDALEQQSLYHHSQQIRRIMLIALDPSPQKVLSRGRKKTKEHTLELD